MTHFQLTNIPFQNLGGKDMKGYTNTHYTIHTLQSPRVLFTKHHTGAVGLCCSGGDSGTVVEKSFSNQKVASSIPCRSVLEQDSEPLIAPDVQCAISVNVKCVYIVSRTYVSRFG